jgi:hypothetical protein
VLTVTMLATESYALANVVGEADFTVSGQLGEPLAAARIMELCRADQLIAVDGNLTRAVLARCGRPGKWLPPDSGRSLKIFGPGWVGRGASRQ